MRQRVLTIDFFSSSSSAGLLYPPELLKPPSWRADQAQNLATNLSSVVGQRTLNINGSPQDAKHSAAELWPHGWRLSQGSALLTDTLCSRQVGLQTYISFSSTEVDDGRREPASLDPVGLHRDFCPYRDASVVVPLTQAESLPAPISLDDGAHTTAVQLLNEIWGSA